VRVVTVSECASHAVVDAEIGPIAGKGSGEQALARKLWPRLAEGWLLIADRNFYSFADWKAAAATGAALLWRVKADLALPVLEMLPDGSYQSVLVDPGVRGKARARLVEAARAGQGLDPEQAALVRVVEYEVPDRDGDGKGELIALITTIADPAQASAQALAEAYHQRWEHETGNSPARPGPGAAVEKPGHGPPRDLRLPARPPRDQRLGVSSRHRGRHRPRPGQAPPNRAHRPPPRRRPGGLFPLSSRNGL
jgi:hypothetical protein